MKNKISTCLYLLICAVFLWYLYESIVFSKEIMEGVSRCFIRIVNVVFPSLFGFMAVCEILIKSGLIDVMAKIFVPISKYLFRMPEKLFAVYLFSCIGGYPVGVKLLGELVRSKDITKETASGLAPFCYCVSPSFAVGIVGLAVFSDVKIGLIVYFSCLISNTLALLVYSRIYNFKCEKNDTKVKLTPDILVNSVASSGKSMLLISGMILFFAYFVILLDCLNFFDIIKIRDISVILKSSLEITYISNLATDFKLLPVVTGIVSCGGLCILLQVLCLNSSTFSLKRLFLMRIPLSLASALVCYVTMRHILVYNETISYAFSQKKSSDLNVLSLICLFFMIIIICL